MNRSTLRGFQVPCRLTGMSSLERRSLHIFQLASGAGKSPICILLLLSIACYEDNPLSRVNYLSDNRDLMDRVDSGKTQDKVFAVYNNHPWHRLYLSEPHPTLPESLHEIGRGFLRLVERQRGDRAWESRGIHNGDQLPCRSCIVSSLRIISTVGIKKETGHGVIERSISVAHSGTAKFRGLRGVTLFLSLFRALVGSTACTAPWPRKCSMQNVTDGFSEVSYIQGRRDW